MYHYSYGSYKIGAHSFIYGQISFMTAGKVVCRRSVAFAGDTNLHRPFQKSGGLFPEDFFQLRKAGQMPLLRGAKSQDAA